MATAPSLWLLMKMLMHGVHLPQKPVLRIEGDFKVTLDNVHPLGALDVSGSGTISEGKGDRPDAYSHRQ